MLVKIGTYVSDGSRQTIPLGFRAKKIYIKGDTSENIAQRSDTIWCARTNTLAAGDSFLDGVAFVQNSVIIGAANEINTSGVRYYWCAIGDDGSSDFDIQSWLGNGQAGNQISLSVQNSPIFAEIKRDSSAAAVMKFADAPSALATGVAVDECFSAISSGAVTLNNVVNVNEYDSAGGLGEGIDGFFVFNSGNASTVTWASGTSGQFIDCGCDPLAAIIVRTDTTGVPAHFVTRDMPNSAPVTNSGIAANTATLVPGGILLGSAATLRTGTFHAVVFGRKETNAQARPPAIIVRERKGVYLPGRGTAAQIDCGVSDATLRINGAISIEWYGVLWADQYSSNIGGHLIQRGVGPAATVGAYSWGLAAVHVQDFSWSGPQLSAITTNQWNEVAPLDAAVWRTGIIMPWGKPSHIVATHDGSGKWRMYLNGKMVKQRNINLATNIVSGAGHRTSFGMRRNTADTAWTQAQRMIVLSGRVYARQLSADDVSARFEREAMGSSGPDVTTALAEEWDARNAAGLLLPASVNSANNGAISATARIITL